MNAREVVLEDLETFLRDGLGIDGAVSYRKPLDPTVCRVNTDHSTTIRFSGRRFKVETRFGTTTIMLADPSYREKILRLCLKRRFNPQI